MSHISGEFAVLKIFPFRASVNHKALIDAKYRSVEEPDIAGSTRDNIRFHYRYSEKMCITMISCNLICSMSFFKR